jgi:hypothetical protein
LITHNNWLDQKAVKKLAILPAYDLLLNLQYLCKASG